MRQVFWIVGLFLFIVLAGSTRSISPAFAAPNCTTNPDHPKCGGDGGGPTVEERLQALETLLSVTPFVFDSNGEAFGTLVPGGSFPTKAVILPGIEHDGRKIMIRFHTGENIGIYTWPDVAWIKYSQLDCEGQAYLQSAPSDEFKMGVRLAHVSPSGIVYVPVDYDAPFQNFTWNSGLSAQGGCVNYNSSSISSFTPAMPLLDLVNEYPMPWTVGFLP